MEPSLLAARSAILSAADNQAVIANNLANVKTTSFKKSLQLQTDLNVPGTRIAAVRADFSDGSSAPTNRNLDVAIQGDGFFQIDINGAVGYTRAGAFTLDGEGNLVTPQGYFVEPQIAVPENAEAVIRPDGRVFAREDDGTVTEIGQLEAVRFPNNHGLLHIGDGLFKQGPNSGDPVTGEFGDDDFPTLLPAHLEEANVDLAEEFTSQIVNQRWFQTNARVFQATEGLIGEAIDLVR